MIFYSNEANFYVTATYVTETAVIKHWNALCGQIASHFVHRDSSRYSPCFSG